MKKRNAYTVRSTDGERESVYGATAPGGAAEDWARDWLDSAGDSCTVLVTLGDESWRFEVSVLPPEYDVKEVTL